MAEKPKQTAETTERVASATGLHAGPDELGIFWVIDGAYAGLDLLRAPRLRIGRGDECRLRLEHGSVSRTHAELYRQGPIYALRDCASTNGTFLNGARAEHCAVSAGDVLRFGECLGIVASVDPNVTTRGFEALAPGLWAGPSLAAALATARAAAPTDLPIVLVGETGSGKERIARALHQWSGRTGRFHAVNCSTVPAALAEAELFGHQRGAFTGAERARSGHFQAAHEGTLFLDEIADLPLDVQAKLLRVLEAGEVVPLGGTASTPLDVRVVAASQEPITRLVAEERFRADLHARLAGFVVEVPPLRKRREEIPGLFLKLLEKHAAGTPPKVAPTLFEWLCLRPWPGNVRELELLARKLLALHGAEPVLQPSFAQAVAGVAPERVEGARVPTPAGFRDRREHDLHRLKLALAKSSGNVTAAAESIGISRRRAYRLLDTARASEAELALEENELQ